MQHLWHDADRREPKSSEITVSDNSPVTNRLSHRTDFGRTKFILVMHKESGRSLARIAGSNPAGTWIPVSVSVMYQVEVSASG
jgi:hypothetical protein